MEKWYWDIKPVFVKDDTGTTFLFILKTKFDNKYGPQMFKLKKK